ncbi:heterokaryon incompatibility protein-domain-containing protein [Triangularia verruculosa]|uniref:Heterokaryon incompatibility protein-domain-containing protein n=1 Tax=Triangularia verruculosa TaxID=2587418 RepID=A0AAN6XR83_9PEZI|nr:heterokaryon incompatibility protein-domain-containing protein [Triangularia verruculosa]
MAVNLKKLRTIAQSLRAFNYHTAAKLEKPETDFRLLELYPASTSVPAPTSTSRPSTAAAFSEPSNNDETKVDEAPPLVCRLFTTPLSNPCQPFKALSYVWGSDATPYSIHVLHTDPDGTTTTLKLPITSSLYTALLHLRDPETSQTLWIDQLCIDQSNNQEKAAQVSLMGKIYSSASQVLVWLGEAKDNSHQLMQLWAAVGQEMRDIGVEKYYTKEGWPILQRILDGTNPDDLETQQFHAIVKKHAGDFAARIRDGSMTAWFQREWFTRAWVIQEFCMCPDTVFVCGHERFEVDLMLLAGQVLSFTTREMMKPPHNVTISELGACAEDPTPHFFSCRKRRRKYEDKLPDATGDTLFDLMRKMFVGRDTRAKVWRDRVYSLLGLAVDGEVLGIKPDYEDLWGEEKTRDIMTDIARKMITNEASGRVEVLCYARSPKAVKGLPSWVPDWKTNEITSYYYVNEATDQHYFAACGQQHLKAETIPSWSSHVLGLKGFWVDTVDALAPANEVWSDVLMFDSERELRCLQQVVYLLGMAASRPGNPYPSEERRAETVWRVPIADAWQVDGSWVRASRDHNVHVQCQQAYDCLLWDRRQNTERPEEARRIYEEFGWEEKRQRGELGAKYRQFVSVGGGNKKPFLTAKGFLGMGPPDMQVGDGVVVFCGGRIPFVVRQLPVKKGEKETFQLLGEAFCDGIMDGEAAVEENRRDFFLETAGISAGFPESPRISPTFPHQPWPELHQIWKFGTSLRRTTRQLLLFVDSWMLAAGFLASTSSAIGPNVPDEEKRLPGKPAPMPNWKWPNPFQSSRAAKYEATCQVQRSFKAEEFKLDDLAQNPPLGLLPWRDALKDVFAEREYPGGWDGIDNHGYDRNVLKMDYETVPLKVREWIEEQERKELPGQGLFALFARPAPGTRVFKQVPVPEEPTPEFREKDDRRVVIFAPGAIYESLPLWLGEDSGCDDEMLDLSRYSGQAKNGGVIGYPIFHSKPERSKGERDIEFSLLAQVVKLKEGETEDAEAVESPSQAEAEKPAATEAVKEAVKEAAKEATEAAKDEL